MNPLPPTAAPAAEKVAPSADYYTKPAMSFGALRAALLGLLLVFSIVGGLLLYWLHAPATDAPAAQGQPAQQLAAGIRR